MSKVRNEILLEVTPDSDEQMRKLGFTVHAYEPDEDEDESDEGDGEMVLEPNQVLFCAGPSADGDDDGYAVYFCPKSFWEKNKYQYDDHVEFTVDMPYDGESEMECVYVFDAPKSKVEKALLKLGFLQDSEYTKFINQ